MINTLSENTYELFENVKHIAIQRKWFLEKDIHHFVGYQDMIHRDSKYTSTFVRIDIEKSLKYSDSKGMGTQITWILEVLRNEIVDVNKYKYIAIVFGEPREALNGMLNEFFL